MDKRRTKCIQRAETKDNDITSTSPTQKRRKIQDRSRCIRTCNWRSSLIRTRTMLPVERNYEIYNKKLLAIVKALDKWRQYLLDVIKKFEVQTDHKNLKYFKELHKLNGQQVRQYLKLQDYDFILQHIPKKTNTKADILSRREKMDIKEDNQDIQMLKEELWVQ